MNEPVEPIVVDDRGQDRLVKGLQFGTAVLTVIVLILAGMTLPAALSGADNSSRVQESTDNADRPPSPDRDHHGTPDDCTPDDDHQAADHHRASEHDHHDPPVHRRPVARRAGLPPVGDPP